MWKILNTKNHNNYLKQKNLFDPPKPWYSHCIIQMQQKYRYFWGNKLLQGFVIWAKQLFKYTVSVSLEFFQICNFSHILTIMSEITITCRWGRFILLKPLKSYRHTKEKIVIVRHFSLEMMSNPWNIFVFHPYMYHHCIIWFYHPTVTCAWGTEELLLPPALRAEWCLFYLDPSP